MQRNLLAQNVRCCAPDHPLLVRRQHAVTPLHRRENKTIGWNSRPTESYGANMLFGVPWEYSAARSTDRRNPTAREAWSEKTCGSGGPRSGWIRTPRLYEHIAFPRRRCLCKVSAPHCGPVTPQPALGPGFPLHRIRVVENAVEFLHFSVVRNVSMWA